MQYLLLSPPWLRLALGTGGTYYRLAPSRKLHCLWIPASVARVQKVWANMGAMPADPLGVTGFLQATGLHRRDGFLRLWWGLTSSHLYIASSHPLLQGQGQDSIGRAYWVIAAYKRHSLPTLTQSALQELLRKRGEKCQLLYRGARWTGRPSLKQAKSLWGPVSHSSRSSHLPRYIHILFKKVYSFHYTQLLRGYSQRRHLSCWQKCPLDHHNARKMVEGRRQGEGKNKW